MKCERCGRVLRSQASIERGMGPTCARITELEKTSKPEKDLTSVVVTDLLERVRKIELDNRFMKHQLKHKHFSVQTHSDAELDWEIKPEVQEVIEVFKGEFGSVIRDLRSLVAECREDNKPLLRKDFRYTDEELGIEIIEVK